MHWGIADTSVWDILEIIYRLAANSALVEKNAGHAATTNTYLANYFKKSVTFSRNNIGFFPFPFLHNPLFLKSSQVTTLCPKVNF